MDGASRPGSSYRVKQVVICLKASTKGKEEVRTNLISMQVMHSADAALAQGKSACCFSQKCYPLTKL